jgi:hypothetical protein
MMINKKDCPLLDYKKEEIEGRLWIIGLIVQEHKEGVEVLIERIKHKGTECYSNYIQTRMAGTRLVTKYTV